MKIPNGFLVVAAVIWGVSAAPAVAKTAKDCTAEWRADKAGMQSRGVTEKAYVEQCRGGAETPAAAPATQQTQTPPPPARGQATAGSKTAKDCIAEWRADKAGMQARGVTQKAYVEQCRTGAAPAASVPSPQPSASTPPAAAPAPTPAPSTSASSSQKTGKECIAEWRADKAGMQARGVTEKAYVEQCRTGGAAPSAKAIQPTTPAAPAPVQPAPTATQAAPAPVPQRSAPTATAAPVPAPAQQAPVSRDNNTTLEGGQFADEASAKARCPSDTIVWVNLPSKVYHFAGTRNYGTTKRGAYMCEKEAIAAEDHAARNETHP